MQEKIQLRNLSEHDYEQCLKCSICTAYCPVSTVEPEYLSMPVPTCFATA